MAIFEFSIGEEECNTCTDISLLPCDLVTFCQYFSLYNSTGSQKARGPDDLSNDVCLPRQSLVEK
jgi:hypothetical protein